jgi:hypothetical protein
LYKNFKCVFQSFLVYIQKKFKKHILKLFSKAKKIQKTRFKIFINGKIENPGGKKETWGWEGKNSIT